jgi:hypothetical protein
MRQQTVARGLAARVKRRTRNKVAGEAGPRPGERGPAVAVAAYWRGSLVCKQGTNREINSCKPLTFRRLMPWSSAPHRTTWVYLFSSGLGFGCSRWLAPSSVFTGGVARRRSTSSRRCEQMDVSMSTAERTGTGYDIGVVLRVVCGGWYVLSRMMF